MRPFEFECLQQAAKAVGIEIPVTLFQSGGLELGIDSSFRPAGGIGGGLDVESWNPASDDGDCARMEAALMLRVTFRDGHVSVGHESFGIEEQCEFYSDHGGDRNSARRSASTYAAASIGRDMP